MSPRPAIRLLILAISGSANLDPIPAMRTPDPTLFPRGRLWWVLLWACLVSSLYIPTLSNRFDFIDDSILVYPLPPFPLGERVQLVWDKIVADYRNLGPFRPVVWAYWETQAELFGAEALPWRLVRLVWTAVATGVLLWLLLELGLRPGAVALTAALAMWNPYRSDIWISVTVPEGVAMPFALLGLVCAIRAARSLHPWAWDTAGILCVLVALGCKNTFAAVVPAQVLLRVASDGQSLREGWRRHGGRACLLALTLLIPVAHYILFALNWHPGQYRARGPSWGQLHRMLSAVNGAIGIDFTAPGLVLAMLALLVNGLLTAGSPSERRVFSIVGAARRGFRPLWDQYRTACLAGLALLVFGIGIYLPMEGVTGRYSMPAVWGADLWIAALLSTLAGVTAVSWKRAAYTLLTCGLVALALANLGRQDKSGARAAMLWQALEFVERQAPPGASLGWIEGPNLSVAEGIHFSWHLRARGRREVTLRLLDAQGRLRFNREVSGADQPLTFLLTGSAQPPPARGWQLPHEFTACYWARTRCYRCYLWSRETEGSGARTERGPEDVAARMMIGLRLS